MRAYHRKVKIYPTEISDLPDLLNLWNDGRVMRWVGFPEGLHYDSEEVAEWLSVVQSKPDRNHFVIRDAALVFCGELYYEVDHLYHMARLDIKLVPEAQGKGIATQTLSALIDFIFRTEQGVESVWVEPWPENKAAQRLYSRRGLHQRSRPAHLEEGPSYWELQRAEWSDG